MSLATQKHDASETQYMLAPGQPFPSEGGVPQGDVDPTGATHSTTESAPTPATSTSATVSESSSRGLSEVAIAGIASSGVVAVVLSGASLFLLGRQKTMLQFVKRGYYQQPRPRNPPGGQDMRSSGPQMMSSPYHSSSTFSHTVPEDTKLPWFLV